MSLRYDRFLCLDLELTCWEGAPPDGMRPEIIEVGIVEAGVEPFQTSREARYLVRPKTSEIGAYCASLTGIAREDVLREGRTLDVVMGTLAKEFGPARKHLVVWGGDWHAIERECGWLGAANPFPRDNVIDLAAILALSRGRSARLGLSEALALFGLSFQGRPHGALRDAHNTARLFAAAADRLRS